MRRNADAPVNVLLVEPMRSTDSASTFAGWLTLATP